MSSTNVSAYSAMAAASSTRPTASSTVMKNRETSGWVTVTGSARAIWSASTDRNDPRLPRTLPKRTEASVTGPPAARWTTSSASRLLAPSTEVGSAALSVEMRTKRLVPCRIAASSTFWVPCTLDFTASHGWRSSSGRCLCAAAWKTSSGRTAAKT